MPPPDPEPLPEPVPLPVPEPLPLPEPVPDPVPVPVPAPVPLPVPDPVPPVVPVPPVLPPELPDPLPVGEPTLGAGVLFAAELLLLLPHPARNMVTATISRTAKNAADERRATLGPMIATPKEVSRSQVGFTPERLMMPRQSWIRESLGRIDNDGKTRMGRLALAYFRGGLGPALQHP